MAAVTPQRLRLGRRLRELRAVAFPSGLQFAGAVGWPQSRVSKLERGAQIPTEDDLLVWLRATGHGDDRQLLHELRSHVAAARVDYTADRAVLHQGGFAARQAERGLVEAATSKIVEFQPAMIPGLVQTPAYTTELLTHSIGGLVGLPDALAELDEIVAQRIRRQNVLYRPGHRIEVIVGEAALHHRPGPSAATMTGQLDRLVTLAQLDTVRLGIVPLTAPMTALPLTNFTIHDDRLVIIESLGGEQQHDDPEQVATFVAAAAALWDIAAVGDAAHQFLRDASRNHRDAQQ